MSSFNHFVLTRFNVKSTKKDRPNHLNLDGDWLESRLKLFDNFCYPSVQGQSNQNFKWIVFFNIDTSDAFKEKIKKYSKWKNFIPAYISCVFNDIEKIPEEALEIIRANMTMESEYVITTRLDTDDALCKNFVQMVQDNFVEQDGVSINFIYGYVLYDNKLYLRRYPQGNPFISLIEKTEAFKGVFRLSHQRLYEIGSMKNIKNRQTPAWLQILHEANIAQTRSGFLKTTMNQSVRQSIKNLRSSFLINDAGIPIQEKNLLKFRAEQAFSIFRFLKARINLRRRLRFLLKL
ncbi:MULTISPECIES: glycosyltransferase [unclassified Coleofasciculus]|uniref:glycosyltransferase n=1 Tax=unclassified Coleofasciculus TaxID=2692782 RepID=UPI0018827F4B|nr:MULTISPECIES: glycosyltransferase [unclassified Coleofasciculus]MBE9125342.1 hypothetical protein [Coleofasciculus sp. LEGE 07081]MBE9148545.1 hypothetical protein [Coleofasciculus sp. LEGE 07092]